MAANVTRRVLLGELVKFATFQLDNPHLHYSYDALRSFLTEKGLSQQDIENVFFDRVEDDEADVVIDNDGISYDVRTYDPGYPYAPTTATAYTTEFTNNAFPVMNYQPAPASFAVTAPPSAPTNAFTALGHQLAPGPAAAAAAPVAVSMTAINQLVQGGYLHMQDKLHVPLEKFVRPFVTYATGAAGSAAIMTYRARSDITTHWTVTCVGVVFPEKILSGIEPEQFYDKLKKMGLKAALSTLRNWNDCVHLSRDGVDLGTITAVKRQLLLP